jgi:hypothetical protein
MSHLRVESAGSSFVRISTSWLSYYLSILLDSVIPFLAVAGLEEIN